MPERSNATLKTNYVLKIFHPNAYRFRVLNFVKEIKIFRRKEVESSAELILLRLFRDASVYKFSTRTVATIGLLEIILQSVGFVQRLLE
jgi:hypothetical protein